MGSTLDVGCGTGDVAIEILRQAPDSSVSGIDRSEKMVEIGRAKAREAGLEELDLARNRRRPRPRVP